MSHGALKPLFIALFTLSAAPAQAASPLLPKVGSPDGTRVYLHPNLQNGFASDWATVFENPNAWPHALDHSAVVQLWQINIPAYSAAAMGDLVKETSSRGQAIGVESPYLSPAACESISGGTVEDRIEAVAKFSADKFISDTKSIYDAGGSVSFSALDGSGIWPIIGTGYSKCNFSIAEADQALARFLQKVHAVHPDVEFGLIANFPNYNYGGTNCAWGVITAAECQNSFNGADYKDVLAQELEIVRANGEQLTFLHVDNPYPYLQPGNHSGNVDVMKARLLPLRQQASSLGLRFGMILNTDLGGGSQKSLDQTYHDQTVAGVQSLTAAGVLGAGADLIIESWFPYPSAILPESTPYTFTATALDVLAAYEQGAKEGVPLYLNVSSVSQPLASITVYRLYSATSTEHLDSLSSNEGASSGFKLEGPEFQLFPWTSGYTPVFRCLGTKHFLSLDQNCEGMSKDGDYPLGYASPTDQGNTLKKVYRLLNQSNGDHMQSFDPNEGSQFGYRQDAPLGFVVGPGQ